MPYAWTVLAVVAAVGARSLLDPLLGDHLPFVTFFVAVMVAAWLGGQRPAWLATVLGFLGALYLFVPPRQSILGTTGPHLVGLAMYAMVCGAIAFLGEAMWRARRRAESREKAAREQAETLRVTLTSIGDAVITTDASGAVTFLNPVAETLTGVTTAEAAGQQLTSVFTIVNERTRQPVENPIGVVLAQGIVVGLANHTVLVAKGGTEHAIDDSAAPIKDEHGDVIGAVLVFRDVGERRQAEMQLRDSEARFRLLADAMPQIVYVTDPDGKVTFTNNQWRTYTGQSDAQTADLGPLVHPDDLPPMLAAWNVARDTGQPFEAEFRLRRAADGEYRWFLTRSVAVTDGDGRILRWHGTSTDIHEHRLAHERVKRDEARQAFVVSLNDTVRPIATPQAVKAAASRLLGEHLKADRVAYFEVKDDTYVVEQDYVRVAPSMAGVYPVSSFGPGLLEAYQRGEAVISADVGSTPDLSDAERQAYADIGVRAYIGMPLVKNGRFVAGLAVQSAAPRVWSDDEIAVVRATADRTWSAVERARAESALMASEERFRTLFETMDEGFCVVDMIFAEDGTAIDYRIIEMNPAFERHTGLHGVLGRTVRDFAPNLERFWFDAYGAVARTGTPTRFVQQSHELEARWFEVYAFRLGGPGSTKVAILFNDITAKKAAEHAAERRSDQVQRLAAVLPRISAVGDIASVMRLLTDESRVLIGAHLAVATFVRGEDWHNAVVVSSLSDKYAAWRAFDTPPTGAGIYTLVCRTNTPMRLTQEELEAHPDFQHFGNEGAAHPPLNGWLAAPLLSRDGSNMGVLQLSDKLTGAFAVDDEAVLLQLTQMAAVAIDNARLVDDLTVADRRKDEFLATLAHELRNPLAPMRTALHLLSQPDVAPEVAQRVRDILGRQLGQMVHLVDDLLDLSRISRNVVELRIERVDIRAAVEAAVEATRPLIEATDHELTLDIPSDAIHVDADVTRLAQVFSNLLNNAAKYTDRGGKIRVSVRQEADEVLVSVADTGIGIPSELLPTVFEMFTQVDRSMAKSSGGLGIGLSLVKRLVELHGGTVVAQSAGHGAGSEFVVRLPLRSRPPAVDPREEPPTTDDTLVSRRVLVADDNHDAAASLAMLLSAWGHVVVTAHDGEAAMEAAIRDRPEIVLLDLGMPKLHGYQVAQRIRGESWGDTVTLVALTGWSQPEDRQRSAAAGFDHHLAKPVDPRVLQQLLAPPPTSG